MKKMRNNQKKYVQRLRKNAFALCLSLLVCIPAFAGETGKVAGKVSDKESGSPLAFANVFIRATYLSGKKVEPQVQLGASTDEDGTYFIINVPPGKYDIVANFVGYQDVVVEEVVVFIDKTTEVDFDLPSEAITSDVVVVVGYRPDVVEKDVTATKLSYDVKEVMALPGITDVGDIIGLQADVSDGHFRGGRSGESLYLVSGASILNPLNNSAAFEPMTAALEQVEVYTSGFSAEYGNVQSGVINMVTKEGQSKWSSRVEMAMTNSYYKTFGGSIYSPDNLDFYKLLNDPEEWLSGRQKDKVLWTLFGLGIDSFYGPQPDYTHFPPSFGTHEDSLRAANLVRQLWRQSARETGLEYDQPDYRLDFTTGGPIAKNMTLFFGGRQNFINPVLPSPNPDQHSQLIGSLSYRINPANKLKIFSNFDQRYISNYSTSYKNWFERELQITKVTEQSFQIGSVWNSIINNSTFFEIGVNYLYTNEDDQGNLLDKSIYGQEYTTSSNWRFYTTPSGHTVGKFNTDRGYERTKSFGFNSSITNQANKYHMLKGGLQFKYYHMDVFTETGYTNASSYRYYKYDVRPYEGAVFVQDKMEFEGMIANVGMRYDFYNYNTTYYTDKFSPYRNPNFDPTDESSGSYFDKNLAGKEDTKLVGIIQPRVGISFPVSEETVLHLNYGVFVQRPAFQYIYQSRYKLTGNPDFVRLGNPQLEPERTLSYDLGVVQSLPLGFYLDLSAYLKDVSNLTQQAIYVDSEGNQYDTFENRDYADIKGFQINLEKKSGSVRGYLRYNWQEATGKSAGALGSAIVPTHYETNADKNITLPPEDILMDFDRTHKFVSNLTYYTTPNEDFLGTYIFSDLIISATYQLQSGRPFTYDPTGQNLRYNQRAPNERNLKMRIDKKMKWDQVTINLYFEGFNLLNEAVYYYSRMFNDASATAKKFTDRYMTDPNSVLTDPEFAPYTTSLEAYLYSNQPRHFRFGLYLTF